VPDSCRSYINLLFECKRGMVSVIVREANEAERERERERESERETRRCKRQRQTGSCRSFGKSAKECLKKGSEGVPDSCCSYINLLFECKRGMVSVIVREVR
jgi:hypothetical protein